MTKKRFRTKRRRVKKQMRRKSRKARKNMKGGTREFVQKIASCIPNNPRDYPDMPFSPSGYINNDDNWTKLAENISENGPIEFLCGGETAIIGGIDENLMIDYRTNTKRGELYGKIGESRPILLWRNGIQQTYQAPSTASPASFLEQSYISPQRSRAILENGPPPLNRIVDSRNQYRSPPGSPSVGSSQVVGSLFNEEDNPDDDGRDYYPGQ
jgi:hypothetical protein